MENPFEIEKKETEFSQEGFYSDFVKNQISKANIGDSLIMDLGGKDLPSCRSRIQYVSGKLDVKFRTKFHEGNLWVKRIKWYE